LICAALIFAFPMEAVAAVLARALGQRTLPSDLPRRPRGAAAAGRRDEHAPLQMLAVVALILAGKFHAALAVNLREVPDRAVQRDAVAATQQKLKRLLDVTSLKLMAPPPDPDSRG